MYKDLRNKLKFIYTEYIVDHFSTTWGLKVIFFATKEEGMIPRGFGFLIHKTSDFYYLYSEIDDRKIPGYGLVILCRPFPPLQVKWTFK